MEYTAQNLEYAVSVFYNGEQAERTRAHAWLTAAQGVPEAWKFVWELLQPTKGTEIQFYAATTLHTKILRCWNELPPESYDELKEKLLQAVFAYSKGPKIVTNRLCISLAAFILQQGTIDLATILRPLSSAENTSLLLEVLTVIPEEYNSMTMGSVLRNKNRTALQQACPAVLDDMLRYLNTVYNDYSNEGPTDDMVQVWLSAATCAGSWLTLGGEDAPEIGSGSLPDRLPLCRALLAVVKVLYMWNDAVSDIALDACEACLAAVRAAATPDHATRQPTAALHLLKDIVALAAPIMARDNAPNSINEELLSAMVTCLVAIGECHAHTLVQAAESTDKPDAPENIREGAETARQLVELLLAAQASPGHYPLHETRSNLVFGFWYTLQNQVQNMSEQQVCPLWREVFSRLLTALVCKSEAPAESALASDDLELLRCYRQDIADTVIYCFGILHEWCWSVVEAVYASADSEVRREAALHVFLALCDVAPAGRDPQPLLAMLQRAVDVVQSSSPAPILTTALDCLGGYAAWMGSVESPRTSAMAAASLRAAGAALQRSPAAASLALRKLCIYCSAPAAALATDIVHAAQNSAGRSEDVWVRRQLTIAAGAALAAAEPPTAAPLLQRLADMLRDDLDAQAREPTRRSGAAESTAALVNALEPRSELAAQLFSTVAGTLPAFAIHPALVEPMSHVLKHTVSTLMNDCLPVVAEIAQLTITGFNTKPCASGLDVVKFIVIIVGNEWSECCHLLHASVLSSARAVAADPSGHADLTEALFMLLRTITKKRPEYIDWIEDLLPELVELGCNCVRLWEASAARSACYWLAVLAARRPVALQPHAPALTTAALRCIGGATPRNQIEPLAELLLALNRGAWRGDHDLAAWLRQALGVAGFPTHHATEPHKQKFIAAVIKEKSSKRRLLDTVQEFSLVCRGLVETEYARQALASRQLVA